MEEQKHTGPLGRPKARGNPTVGLLFAVDVHDSEKSGLKVRSLEETRVILAC